MDEFCEIVSSQKGCDKLKVRGYLMVKDKNVAAIYYWCCASRKVLNCNGRVITTLEDGQHKLAKFVDHNHAPNTNASRVVKVETTRVLPCQSFTASDTAPSGNTVRVGVQRKSQGQRPTEPKMLADVEVPALLQNTLNGDPFLIRDLTVENHRILLFTTKSNIEKLSRASVWIMDGVFKTASAVYFQLYTIHAPVGSDRSTTYPLVYVLMSERTEVLYKRLFEELVDFAVENDFQLHPHTVMTDLELEAIKASVSEFQGVLHKICFFHSTQCIWRKIQSTGLSARRNNDENFGLMRSLSELAFLPAEEIPGAFNELKPHFPEEAREVTEWFESNFVHGRVRHFRNSAAVRSPAMFPPSLWSVYDCMQNGFPPTETAIEAWHRRWENVIGSPHVTVGQVIEEFQKEQHELENEWKRTLRIEDNIGPTLSVETEPGEEHRCDHKTEEEEEIPIDATSGLMDIAPVFPTAEQVEQIVSGDPKIKEEDVAIDISIVQVDMLPTPVVESEREDEDRCCKHHQAEEEDKTLINAASVLGDGQYLRRSHRHSKRKHPSSISAGITDEDSDGDSYQQLEESGASGASEIFQNRQRFSEKESEVLINGVIPVYDKLYGRLARTACAKEKHAIWQEIQKAVYAVSFQPRKIEHLRKRFSDIKRIVMRKLASCGKRQQSANGNRSMHLKFKPYERVMQSLMFSGNHFVTDSGSDSENEKGPLIDPTKVSEADASSVPEEHDEDLISQPWKEETSEDTSLIVLDSDVEIVSERSDKQSSSSHPTGVGTMKDDPQEPVTRATTDESVCTNPKIVAMERRLYRHSLNKKLGLMNRTLRSIYRTSQAHTQALLQQNETLMRQNDILERLTQTIDTLARSTSQQVNLPLSSAPTPTLNMSPHNSNSGLSNQRLSLRRVKGQAYINKPGT